MKNTIKFFITAFCIAPILSANAAVTIKKADSVTSDKTTTSKSSAATSLAPTVLGLVSGVMDMKNQQKTLSAQCIPSQKEREFIDKMMKEWAKSGKDVKSIEGQLKRTACKSETGDGYSMDVQMSDAAGASNACYNSFKGPGNTGMIWEGFPRVGFANYKDNGKDITKSDAYDLFAMIDFEPVDYTESELTMAGNLLQKVEGCSGATLNAKKKALWGTFLLNTAGSVGQKTDTSTILQQVSGITSNSSGSVGGSLGTAATQMLLMKVSGGE